MTNIITSSLIKMKLTITGIWFQSILEQIAITNISYTTHKRRVLFMRSDCLAGKCCLPQSSRRELTPICFSLSMKVIF